MDSGGFRTLTGQAFHDGHLSVLVDGCIDPALVLGAYRTWEEDCPRFLPGEYAFAVWDAARQRLFCARDSAGVVPFFYAVPADGRLLFASDAGALLARAGIPRATDQAGMVDFLISRGTFAPHRSPAGGLRRLGPAQVLSYAGARLQVSSYWSVFEASGKPFSNREEGPAACAAALHAAIRDRLQGAPRAGISLSGGWDSGAVFAIWQWMRRADPQLAEPCFYTYYGDTPESDERAEVEALLGQWPARGQYEHLDTAAGLDGLEQRCALTGMPEAASGWRWLTECAAWARREGITRVLTGEAGNEVFQSSVLRPADLLRRGRLLAAYRQTRTWAEENETSLGAFVWPFVLRPVLAAILPRPPARRQNPWPFLSASSCELARDLVSSNARRTRRAVGTFAGWDKRISLERWCSELFPIPPLEGVRLSAPFLDRRVVTAALQALETEREASSTRGLLAATVQYTTGDRFRGRHAHYTAALDGLLRAALERTPGTFAAPTLAELGLVEPARLRDYVEAFRTGRAVSLPLLWRVVALEVWARWFLSAGEHP